MDKLLPEVWTMKEGGEPEPKRRCGRKVLDIFTWLQCFGIYVSIRGMQSPTSIPEFMAYMSMIVTTFLNFKLQEYVPTIYGHFMEL